MRELFLRRVSIVLLCISGVALVALQLKPMGWALLALTGASLLFADKKFRRDIFLVVISLGILGITPINTDISVPHMFLMGLTLFFAVAIPYLISRFVYQEHGVHFQWLNGRRWDKSEFLFIGLTAVVAYFLLPYYLKTTGAYLNWSSASDHASIVRLFIGTNALGIWDELFFISTVLGIFRRYFSFISANIFQAILFTSFLYELGFTGWGPVMIFPFALLQGYIFMKTHSLLYVIAIHLAIDLVLFLAIIYSHHPNLAPLFIS